VAQAADVMLPVAIKTGVEILTRPLHVTVMADADRMIQVLTNLLSNAIKFSPSHTGIKVTAERSGENLVIVSVRDHGPGISTDHLERIFDRFLQVDSSDARAMGGSGLA
jgi:signal transduction histidine kinase